jgi:methyl-accepting chemotaxis protein
MKEMIISCDNCGKEYRIKPELMTRDRESFNCIGCQSEIVVTRVAEPSTADSAPLEGSLEAETETAVDEARGAPMSPKRKRRFGLVPRIVTVMLLVALVPLLGYGVFSLLATSQRLEINVENLGREITLGLASHVEEWIDKNVRVLNALAHVPDMQSMDPGNQVPLLEAVQKQYPWMYLVFTTDINGNNISRSDGKALRDYSDRQYYKDVMDGKKLAWQNLIGKTSKQPAMVLAVPIKSGDQTIGVLANAMTTDALSKRIATWRQGKTGYAFLVDETGKVVAHPKKDFVVKQINLKTHPLVTASMAGKKGIVEFEEEDGVPYLGQAIKTSLGWTLAIQQSRKEAFRELKSTQSVAILILIGTIIMVVLIALAMGRTLVKPIAKLTRTADRISVGELDIEIRLNRNDEIGDLANAIGRMQDSIRIAIERLRRRR